MRTLSMAPASLLAETQLQPLLQTVAAAAEAILRIEGAEFWALENRILGPVYAARRQHSSGTTGWRSGREFP